MARCCPRSAGRGSSVQGHSIELPVAGIVVAAENEPALRAALVRALEYGKGVVHVLAHSNGNAARRGNRDARCA
jgi:hypothetical protein